MSKEKRRIGKILVVEGDATLPQGDGPKILAHIVNDARKWGRGFVVPLGKRYPQARESYLHGGPPLVLGSVQFCRIDDQLTIANMCAQHGLRSKSNPRPLDYDALRQCLHLVGKAASARGASVHMPAIGCGLAGGRWHEVRPIIGDEICVACDVPVTVCVQHLHVLDA